MQRVLISIHDVMPETLEPVERLLEACLDRDLRPITLLVVPGRPWTPPQLDKLREWLRAGCQLAGHGWLHHCPTIRGLYHRLHSLLISRRVAEHLSHSPDQRVELMRRCSEWFPAHDLPSPELYVPPAWALGKLPPQALLDLPFEMVESLTGVWKRSEQRWVSLPLTGYETDQLLKAASVSLVNQASRTWAACQRRPLRLSIHPHDDKLLLRRQLERDLDRVELAIGYGEL